MSELDTIEQQVIDLIARKERIPPGSITLDSTLQELGIDSLAGMDLLFDLEETHKLMISDEVAQQMKTVRHVVEAIRTAAQTTQADAATTLQP